MPRTLRLLAVVSLLALMSCREDTPPSMAATHENLLERPAPAAERWRLALQAADAREALAAARELVPSPPADPLPGYITGLAEQNGIDAAFLTDGFNEWDAQYWHHAAYLRWHARQLTAKLPPTARNEKLQALLDAVHARIEPVDPPTGTIMWPYQVWELRQGLCDRQAWLFCELAYQLDFETQVVYLRDPDTLESPHTVAEIRYGTEAWVVDPMAGKLLVQTSIADLAADPEAARRLWPDRPDWQRGLLKPAFYLPAYPQDYCPRNQRLKRRLQAALGDACPRFGEPATERMRAYLALTSEADRDAPYSPWFYPFRVLRDNLALAVHGAQDESR